ncbi:DUF6223 family protein [Actinacidiphila glaucinigra]|uniref:DUF6223 family protein n=1 Tax=Actinacidiphila glaucinigra TaxID=235986 RepID=UPI0033BF5010
MPVRSALTAPAVAHALAQQAATGSYGLTPERFWASTAALLALVGVLLGALALTSFAGRIRVGNGRAPAIAAMAAGLVSVVNGGLVVVTADGGPGTGNGIVGGFVAVVIGLIAVALARLALIRARRAA